MYIKHFAKMFLWLILMAVIGLGFLVAVNRYYKRDALAGITPSSNVSKVATSSIK